MRTTLNLDDDVLARARVLAEEQSTSIGAVVSELVRRGWLSQRVGTSRVVPVFKVDPDSPSITLEMVRAACEE